MRWSAAINAYLTGAAALAEQLRAGSRPKALQLVVALSGMTILGGGRRLGLPRRTWSQCRPPCSSPSTCSARHRPRGSCAARSASRSRCLRVTAVILGFSGPVLIVVAAVVAVAALVGRAFRRTSDDAEDDEYRAADDSSGGGDASLADVGSV